ncbi:MAG: hypothetical protein ACFBZ9_18470 [Sphingomonadales bacterium]
MEHRQEDWTPKSIWLLALAYGGSYAAFLIALRYGVPVPAARPAILTGFAIGVLLFLPVPIAALGQRARTLGKPDVKRGFWSGISAAVIALATAIAFSFDGIGILTALLFMRGGVLILSPLIDRSLGRSVAVASWIALGLSLIAVSLAIWGLGTITVSPALGATLGLYLLGYGVRLSFMTRAAKSDTAGLRAVYLSQELIWTATALGIAAFGLWLSGRAPLAGFLPFLPAGLAYASALTAGSLIYLDARENSFTIPINRGASLLAGLFVAFCFAAFGVGAPPKGIDLIAAGFILCALSVLAFKPLQHHNSAQKRHSKSSRRHTACPPYGRVGQ